MKIFFSLESCRASLKLNDFCCLVCFSPKSGNDLTSYPLKCKESNDFEGVANIYMYTANFFMLNLIDFDYVKKSHNSRLTKLTMKGTYRIRANRTPLLIRTPGTLFGRTMVIFG